MIAITSKILNLFQNQNPLLVWKYDRESSAYRLTALFVYCVADLLINHLTLLLCDRLRDGLTFLLLLTPALLLVDNVAPGKLVRL